ncbi:MAG: DUF177 domain-containing protein [Pseudomonadota bacterium]
MSKQTSKSDETSGPLTRRLSVATLSRGTATPFDLNPDRQTCVEIARQMGLSALNALRCKGELTPGRKDGWRLTARLTAKVVQPCVVTLDPVEQSIDLKIVRELLPASEDNDEVDLVLDPDAEDEPDYFEDDIDPGAICLEELALALDPYPRAPGVDPTETLVTPPGADPLDAEALKPFAKLAELKRKLESRDP